MNCGNCIIFIKYEGRGTRYEVKAKCEVRSTSYEVKKKRQHFLALIHKKMKTILFYVVKFIGLVIFYLWVFVSFIVIAALIDWWQDPHTKHISYVDLQDFSYISLYAPGFFAITTFISYLLSPPSKRGSNWKFREIFKIVKLKDVGRVVNKIVNGE